MTTGLNSTVPQYFLKESIRFFRTLGLRESSQQYLLQFSSNFIINYVNNILVTFYLCLCLLGLLFEYHILRLRRSLIAIKVSSFITQICSRRSSICVQLFSLSDNCQRLIPKLSFFFFNVYYITFQIYSKID